MTIELAILVIGSINGESRHADAATLLNLLNQGLLTLRNTTGLPQAVALPVASRLEFSGVLWFEEFLECIF
jgi:hypothetical protein